jgi:hypothetical protein
MVSPHAFDFSGEIVSAGVVDATKLYATPLAKNKIQIRLENLHDYTSQDQSESNTVNVQKIADAFWKSANIASGNPQASSTITEKSLTGNMDIQEMLDRKV